MPAPEETGTGMAYFGDLADAARAVSRVLSSGVLPVTLEFLDRVCIDAVEGYANIGLDREAGALLIFGQDGDRASIDRDMRRMAEACEAEGATQVRIAAIGGRGRRRPPGPPRGAARAVAASSR